MGSRELGALVSFFDTQLKKCVHCTTFLNTFTQVRVTCEEFKGRADEMIRTKEYEQQLKSSYQVRIARNPSVDARPWRQANALTSNNGKKISVFKRRDIPRPQNAMEKYRLRLVVGRKTGRMDLASKNIWLVAPYSASSGPSSPSKSRGKSDSFRDSAHSPLTANDSEENIRVEEDHLEESQVVTNDANFDETEDLFAEIVINTGVDTEEQISPIDRPLTAKDAIEAVKQKQIILPGQPEIEFRFQKIPIDIFRITGKHVFFMSVDTNISFTKFV
jgi:hypothetical protein